MNEQFEKVIQEFIDGVINLPLPDGNDVLRTVIHRIVEHRKTAIEALKGDVENHSENLSSLYKQINDELENNKQEKNERRYY